MRNRCGVRRVLSLPRSSREALSLLEAPRACTSHPMMARRRILAGSRRPRLVGCATRTGACRPAPGHPMKGRGRKPARVMTQHGSSSLVPGAGTHRVQVLCVEASAISCKGWREMSLGRDNWAEQMVVPRCHLLVYGNGIVSRYMLQPPPDLWLSPSSFEFGQIHLSTWGFRTNATWRRTQVLVREWLNVP
jgi:hypothetical protein